MKFAVNSKNVNKHFSRLYEHAYWKIGLLGTGDLFDMRGLSKYVGQV